MSDEKGSELKQNVFIYYIHIVYVWGHSRGHTGVGHVMNAGPVTQHLGCKLKLPTLRKLL